MSALCHGCSNELGAGRTVECRGFCSAVFHLKCTSTTESLLKEMAKNKQTFWLCPSCTRLMNDIRFRKSVKLASEAGQDQNQEDRSTIVELLKTEIMPELKKEIQANFSRLINSSTMTPKSNRLPPLPPRKLTVYENGPGDKLAGPSRNRKSKFWLYLARISNDVTVDQISAFAKSRLATDEVEVFLLVAKGVDVSRMRTISFKVGIASELKDKAMSAETWPRGVYFREFEERSVASADFATNFQPVDPPKSPGLQNQNGSAPPEVEVTPMEPGDKDNLSESDEETPEKSPSDLTKQVSDDDSKMSE